MKILTALAGVCLWGAPALADDRPPVVYLSFDKDMNDSGPYGLEGIVHGDEVYRAAGIKGEALFVGGSEDWLDIPPERGNIPGGWLQF